MLFILKFLSMICLLLCTSCQNIKNTMGLDHAGPDEFDVTPLAPLSLPKDFNKTPSSEKTDQQAAENAASNSDLAKELKPELQSSSSKPETQDTAEIQSTSTNTLAHESFKATHILIGSQEGASSKIEQPIKITLDEKNLEPAVTLTSSQQDSIKQDTSKLATPTQPVLMEEAIIPNIPDTNSLSKQSSGKKVKKLKAHPILQNGDEPLQEKNDDQELTEQEEKLSHKWSQIPDKEIQKHQEAVILFNHTSKLEEEQALLEETQKQNTEKFGTVALPVKKIIAPITQPIVQTPDKTTHNAEAFDTAAAPAKKNKKRTKQAMISTADKTKQNAEESATTQTLVQKTTKPTMKPIVPTRKKTKRNAEVLDTAVTPVQKNIKPAKKMMAQIPDKTKSNVETLDIAEAPAQKNTKQTTKAIKEAADKPKQNSEESATTPTPVQKTTNPAMEPIVQTPRKVKRVRKKKIIRKKQIRRKKPALQKKRVIRRQRVPNNKKKYTKKRKKIVVYQNKK